MNVEDRGTEERPLLLEGMPGACEKCARTLCLRKQVINLALGNDTKMDCLICLAKEACLSPEVFLLKLKSYIQDRSCFLREWEKYESSSSCPDPKGCCPDKCFATS